MAIFDPNLFRQLDQALANLPDDQTPTSQPDPTAPTSASGLCDLLDLLDNYRTESDNTITSDDVNDLLDSLVKARSPMRVAVVDKLSMCLKGEDATTLKALGAFGWATECERVAALLKPKELCHEVGFASTGPDVSMDELPKGTWTTLIELAGIFPHYISSIVRGGNCVSPILSYISPQI